MALRRAALEDAREIGELHLRCWWWAYREIVPHDLLTQHDPDSREEAWSRMLADGREVWVEVIEDRIAGFVALEPPRVAAIYVDPTAQGAGVGNALLAFAEERLAEDGVREGELWTLSGNDHARGWYERHGWSHDGTERDHEWGTEVRYAKPLASNGGSPPNGGGDLPLDDAPRGSARA